MKSPQFAESVLGQSAPDLYKSALYTQIYGICLGIEISQLRVGNSIKA